MILGVLSNGRRVTLHDDDDSRISVNNGGHGPVMDAADELWVQGFIGSSIPEGSLIQGFVTSIAYLDPNGIPSRRMYSSMDESLSSVMGHLELAKMDIYRMSTNCESE